MSGHNADRTSWGRCRRRVLVELYVEWVEIVERGESREGRGEDVENACLDISIVKAPIE